MHGAAEFESLAKRRLPQFPFDLCPLLLCPPRRFGNRVEHQLDVLSLFLGIAAERPIRVSAAVVEISLERAREDPATRPGQLVLSNAQLDRGTVRYTLRKPLAILAEMRGSADWRTRHDSNMRPSDS